MAYLLDANVFIEAKNRHYPFDFFPAFWDWLIQANADKIVFSNQKIKDELHAIQDELSEWSGKRGDEFFLKLPDISSSLAEVAEWANNQHYEQSAIRRFLQDADYFLVAHALFGGYEIVTHEIKSSSQKRIKIPDVCEGLGIAYLTPFEMLRRENARFVLGGN